MGLFRSLGAKAMELIEEDTVYSVSREGDGSSYDLLREASDENYLAYIYAYVRLLEKRKYPDREFYDAIWRTINKRPKNIQQEARAALKSQKN